MNWTDERVELLRKLWSEGLSASQIAAQLGGVSRNAVIGKVHRLKLSGRGRATASPARQKKTVQGSSIQKSVSRAATATRHARRDAAEGGESGGVGVDDGGGAVEDDQRIGNGGREIFAG